ncbi:MAG: threonine synthase [Clostridia bacterium]|nr:threonine synthase [Clostridia bacterium]
MYFISTRGDEKVTGAQAIALALAKDGGLFVPETFPQLTRDDLEKMSEMNYPERAAYVLSKYLDDLGEEFILDACKKAYETFEGEDPIPLVRINEGLYILELYHGPTCSIKDVSLTLFPQLLKRSMELLGYNEEVLLLAATSGDTGKATLQAFRDVKGTKVAIFYPDEGVAKMQKIQICTQSGDNLNVSAIKGNFDDCQRAVRKLFADKDFNEKLQNEGVRLSSTNSMNIARLLPQIAYYFSAYLDLATSDQIEMGDEIDFAVPTGNFEDVLAGWYAKKMGLPIRRLICASNRNRALADFLKTGSYNVKRNFFRTMSPSIDVLLSVNLERLLFEVCGRKADVIADRMKNLSENGEYSITQAELKAIHNDFYGGYATEDGTVEAMYDIFEEYGYAMDTHTGVATAVCYTYRDKEVDEKDRTPLIILSTANPYKFPQDVLYALSGNDVKDSFKGIKRLNLLTAMKPPKCLMELRYKPLRFKGALQNDVKKMSDAVLAFVGGEIVPEPKSEK